MLVGFRWWLLISLALGCAVSRVDAHQMVLTTGYANSRKPETGRNISKVHPPFLAGGGYAAGLRVDIEPPRSKVLLAPAFLFWNNLSGDPDPNANATYFQIELGMRASYHTRTVPDFYIGGGAGYAIAHGEVVAKVDGSKSEYDGSFPSGSLHCGVKTRNRDGLNLVGEIAYQFGLDHARGRTAVGPASAFLVQIGVALDLVTGDQ